MTSQHNRPAAYFGALPSADDKESDSPGQRRCSPDIRSFGSPFPSRADAVCIEVSWC
ncbi:MULTISPECIES: hypothetical protein [Kocuria]|uniref:hypothetical protein n=1 Tax=Kocuria TaxID=57493 RepID=UPI0012E8028D|nr:MULTISPECIES: hypothetical protein [Kocuria]MBN6812777.1 hypothetical protein [Kocuria indica]MBN6844470.1 hypothetical protein [Kocuria indica]MCG7432306.1 hypothetical protein [Kocuria indica]MDT0120076.1 hypothetical protein [Kocuria sp. PD6]